MRHFAQKILNPDIHPRSAVVHVRLVRPTRQKQRRHNHAVNPIANFSKPNLQNSQSLLKQCYLPWNTYNDHEYSSLVYSIDNSRSNNVKY